MHDALMPPPGRRPHPRRARQLELLDRFPPPSHNGLRLPKRFRNPCDLSRDVSLLPLLN